MGEAVTYRCSTAAVYVFYYQYRNFITKFVTSVNERGRGDGVCYLTWSGCSPKIHGKNLATIILSYCYERTTTTGQL